MFKHITVLLHETVDALSIKPDGIYVDCTLGGAGHSQYLLSQLTTGHLYCFDQDMQAIDHAKGRLAKEVEEGKVTFIHANFRQLKKELGIKYFLKVFYRSKKKNKIYICDQTEHFTVIEFNDNKKWNYAKQVK